MLLGSWDLRSSYFKHVSKNAPDMANKRIDGQADTQGHRDIETQRERERERERERSRERAE
jgi:hypothetical protein